MAKWLRVCTAFSKNQRLVSSTHAVQLTLGHLQLQVQEDLKPLVSSGTCIHPQTDRQTETKIHNKTKSIVRKTNKLLYTNSLNNYNFS